MTNLAEIKNLIEGLLQKTGLNIESIEATALDDGGVWCSVKTNDSNLLIGRGGECLEAINHLARRIIEKSAGETEKQPLLTVDVNNYLQKRAENLKALAHMLSERAIFFKSSVEADPMSSYERRIIHEFLSAKPNIKTESVGFGRDRRVIIKYVDSAI